MGYIEYQTLPVTLGEKKSITFSKAWTTSVVVGSIILNAPCEGFAVVTYVGTKQVNCVIAEPDAFLFNPMVQIHQVEFNLSLSRGCPFLVRLTYSGRVPELFKRGQEYGIVLGVRLW